MNVGKILARLQECPLEGWDEEFVDSLTEKHDERGDDMRLTPRQAEQLDRIQRKYLKED